MFDKMKAKNQQTSGQLFATNEPAGKLRLILFVLLLIIYWSFIAQTKVALFAISDNFLALFPNSTNFTSGVIRDIILRYFSPSTIMFTAIPLIVFLSIRKLISKYLHILFPAIGFKESEQYLTKCAFSFPIRNTPNQENIFTKTHHSLEHLKFLGGPANLVFDPSSAFIIQKNNNQGYFLISSNRQCIAEKFILSHGEKIYAFISKNGREVLLKNLVIQDGYGQTIDFGLISLLLFFNTSQDKSTTYLSQKITMHDAKFLSYLGKVERNIIHQFLRDETHNFLHSNVSIMINDEIIPPSSNQIHGKIPDISAKILHENYSKITPTLTKTPRGVSRKHKHSRYIFMKKTSSFSFNKENRKKKLILQLSNHLNEQLKSFFHTSTIQISIIEIRK